MKFALFLFLSAALLYPASAQDWCKKRKPARFEEPFDHSFKNKLQCDRINHTMTPILVKNGYTQIEFSTVLRNEILENGEWVNNPTDLAYNIYNNLLVKHAFSNRIELHFSYTDFLLKGDEAVKTFSKTNMNTAVSIGAKYGLYSSSSKKTRLSLFGQVTIPKPRYTLNTFLTPDVRLLLYHPFGKHLNFTYNLGAAYSPVTEHIFILYGIYPKIEITKRFEVFGEFFKSFAKTGPPRTPIKRGLFGLGIYIMENLYFYSSFEAGWYHEESLNSERYDIGMAYRFL